MSSKVFFTPVSENDPVEIVKSTFLRLLKQSGLVAGIQQGYKAIVKMHFGEVGNTGFVKPEFVGVLCAFIDAQGGTSILSDSNTLYRGRRVESEDHRALALEHGFTKTITGAEVVIADEYTDAVRSIPVDLQFVKVAKIPKCYLDIDLFISLSHFKGHLMCGFGGALKNIGMGCATREGKLVQHSDTAPMVYRQRCTGCGGCVKACQMGAISIVKKIARINQSLCTGCAACIAACRFSAMEVDWEGGSSMMQEKMVEYAAAVLQNVPRAIHVNFATKITAECDCIAKDDPRLIDDVGIFISEDPVACDQASYDAIKKKAAHDLFRKAHPSRDGNRQLIYAEKMGLGSRNYEIIEI